MQFSIPFFPIFGKRDCRSAEHCKNGFPVHGTLEKWSAGPPIQKVLGSCKLGDEH